MRLLSFLVLLIFLNGCTSIKECGVKPTIIIEKGKEKASTEANTKPTPGLVIKNIQENATSGGRIKCTF